VARELGVRKIEASEKGGFFEFAPQNHVDPGWLIGLLQKDPKHWKLDGPTRLKFTRDLAERKTRMAWVQSFVSDLMKNRV
jgi:transcription-repair coupling factor (superfamily II helicase)